MEKVYSVKDVIILDNNKEYSIIKKVRDYYILLSSCQPLEILVVTIKNDVVKIVTDKKIIEKVLKEDREDFYE